MSDPTPDTRETLDPALIEAAQQRLADRGQSGGEG